jgi:hypothetical protein
MGISIWFVSHHRHHHLLLLYPQVRDTKDERHLHEKSSLYQQTPFFPSLRPKINTVCIFPPSPWNSEGRSKKKGDKRKRKEKKEQKFFLRESFGSPLVNPIFERPRSQNHPH